MKYYRLNLDAVLPTDSSRLVSYKDSYDRHSKISVQRPSQQLAIALQAPNEMPFSKVAEEDSLQTAPKAACEVCANMLAPELQSDRSSQMSTPSSQMSTPSFRRRPRTCQRILSSACGPSTSWGHLGWIRSKYSTRSD